MRQCKAHQGVFSDLGANAEDGQPMLVMAKMQHFGHLHATAIKTSLRALLTEGLFSSLEGKKTLSFSIVNGNHTSCLGSDRHFCLDRHSKFNTTYFNESMQLPSVRLPVETIVDACRPSTPGPASWCWVQGPCRLLA